MSEYRIMLDDKLNYKVVLVNDYDSSWYDEEWKFLSDKNNEILRYDNYYEAESLCNKLNIIIGNTVEIWKYKTK